MSGDRDLDLSLAIGMIHNFTPERPLILTPSQYEDVMKIPEIAALTDRLMVSAPLPSAIDRIHVNEGGEIITTRIDPADFYASPDTSE